MPKLRLISLLSLTMIAFAANSLLCRAALKYSAIDPASFTTIRLISGALILGLLVQLRRSSKAGPAEGSGDWHSGLALFAYAAGFSFAYLSLPSATGALLLFGAVQVTMIAAGLRQGERLHKVQLVGLALACGGVFGLLLPGLAAPPLYGALLMLCAGIAWGIYSLRGQGAVDPLLMTAGNFLRAAAIAAVLSLILWRGVRLDAAGFGYAVVSGALASGLGYAIWYRVLPALKATQAASVQLSVPVITALGGVIFLGEPISLRLATAASAILGGIALVFLERRGRLLP